MMAVVGQVQGLVQGVGFRAFVKQQAIREQLQGHAINLPGGAVEVLLYGEREAVERVQQAVSQGPVSSRVDTIGWQSLDPDRIPLHEGFSIG